MDPVPVSKPIVLAARPDDSDDDLYPLFAFDPFLFPNVVDNAFGRIELSLLLTPDLFKTPLFFLFHITSVHLSPDAPALLRAFLVEVASKVAAESKKSCMIHRFIPLSMNGDGVEIPRAP